MPAIPTRCLFLSLVLGVFIRAGSYLAISKQAKRRHWQHLSHWRQRIGDDAFHYAGEAEAALRLLGGIRRVCGVRFFDAVTIDSSPLSRLAPGAGVGYRPDSK